MARTNRASWTPEHAGTILRRIEANLLPSLGSRKLLEIDAVSIIAALRRIENRGAVETAHRVKQIVLKSFLRDRDWSRHSESYDSTRWSA